MITENLSTLKIHKLSKEQYERELAKGTLDANALYLTPEEEVDLSGYVTVEQLDTYVPTSRTVNGKALSSNITLSASDVGADISGAASEALEDAKGYTDLKVFDLQDSVGMALLQMYGDDMPNEGDTPTIRDIAEDAASKAVSSSNHVPSTRTVNGKALSSNIALTAADVGALPNTTEIPDALSDLTSDSTHRTVTDAEKAAWNAKSNFSGSYNDLTDQPAIPSISGLATETYVDNAVSGKVDKVSGKGLSTNDYTSAEKTKLSGIATGAEVNQNAFSNVVVGSTTIAADAKTDSITVAAGTGISVTGDATNDKITITNSGVRSVSTGGTNGTISVNTNGTAAEVAVKGLGSAAYTATTAYDAAGTAQTKADAALASAKTYADGIKNDLLNGAGGAYDTLKELGDLIDDNADAIDALETVAAGKADKTHYHAVADVTGLQAALNNKQPKITGAATSVVSSDLTPSKVLCSSSGGKIIESMVDSAYFNSVDFSHLIGITSDVQTQLDSKASNNVINSHIEDADSHITSAERDSWPKIYNGSSTGSLRTIMAKEEDSEYTMGKYAFAEGSSTVASGYCSHAEGNGTDALGDCTHAEGVETTASGNYSHAEGISTTASGYASHAEGELTEATNEVAHAEGYKTLASEFYSHAEGFETTASGRCSHSEGNTTIASNNASHAEGIGTTSSNAGSHAEGSATIASGFASHAEGDIAVASGFASHAEGSGTTASSQYQHVQGRYNINDADNKYAHIVGNGHDTDTLSNAHTVDWNGLGWFAGGLKVGGAGQDDSSAKTVATLSDIPVEATTSKAGLMSAADKAKLDGIASGATANTGDITGVTAGSGLTGGATSGTATLNVGAGTGISVTDNAVSAKLRNATALTNDSAAATETAGRVYPVAVDKSGYLAVNVPWTDSNTTSFTITASASDDDVVVLSGTNGTNKVTYSASHALKGPSGGYTSNNTKTSIDGSNGTGATGIIKIPQITVDTYGHVTAAADEDVTIKIPSLPTALKNPKSLTVGSKTYDGSSVVSITAADLGLASAMKFLGTSSSPITDGSTANIIAIGDTPITVTAGNVALYGSKEFVWNGSAWEELGNEGSYKIVQTAVSSPSASGTTTAFIDTISQDTNGKITATKKTVASATTSAAGLMSAADKTKLDGIATGATANTGTITGVSANGTSIATSGVANIPAASTSAYGVTKLSSATNSTSTTLAATASAVKAAYDLANGKAGTSVATTSANGLMSSTDKSKLNGIATGAEVNQNAFSNITVGSTTIAADAKTDTLTLVAGSNVTLTPDATNDKITIAATNTTYSAATQSAAGLMSAADKAKLDGVATGANAYSLPTASSSTLGGVKIGSNLSISSGVLSVPAASGTTAGVTIVHPAAQCTTFSSDSGTVTPLAVQKGAKQFAITRPSSSTNKAITRYSNTTGDVQDSTIIIEDVVNTRDSSNAQVIAVPASGGKKMVYGYCTDQVDGTSFIGGIFDASATEYPYSAGLAIGGSSGNLLWKGSKVATVNDITLSALGVTATAAELNKMDGVTATTTELNYVDGVTSNIQTQLNNLQSLINSLQANYGTEALVSGTSPLAEGQVYYQYE